MIVHSLKALEDNYIYIIEWPDSLDCIDPGDAEPVMKFLQETKKPLVRVFLTHHHADHVDGAETLKKRGAALYGPSIASVSIDHVLKEKIYQDLNIRVIATPGHTLDHICYYFEDSQILFSGDTLFASGCGKIFEGTMEQALESLKKLKTLDPKTKIYYGHNYTKKNLEFTLSVDPDNIAAKKLLDSLPVAPFLPPTTLKEELLSNPFLRCDDLEIQKHLNLVGATELEVFTELRKRKDKF